jgi:ribosome-associated protein
MQEFIKLDQFLKWKGFADSGGQAKLLVLDGEVEVNGEIETRRGRKLHHGDLVQVASKKIKVDLSEPAAN